MKRVLSSIASILVVIFTFSSVAWAGATGPIDAKQLTLIIREYKTDGARVPDDQQPPDNRRPPSQQPPDNHRPPSQQPPGNHRPPSQQPPDNHRPPSQQPPGNHRPPSQQPPDNHRPPSQQPPDNHRPPSQQPPDNHRPPSQQPPDNHRPPSQQPPGNHRPPSQQPPAVHRPPAKQPPAVHRPPVHRPPVHRAHNPHNWHYWDHDWPRYRNWNHHFHDWDWFVAFGILSLGAYYADNNYERVVYVQFETENRGYFNEVTKKYGDYIYRERASGFGGEGWRYYWISQQNIICLYVRDDGYTRTFVWNRAETENQAIILGLMTANQLAEYSMFTMDMPPGLAVEYITTVLWGQTEWE